MDRLKAYLTRRPEGRVQLSYHALQGFLFAMVSGPFGIETRQWTPLLLPDMDDAVYDEFCDLYRDIETGIVGGTPALPADCPIAPDPLENLEPDSPLSQWSRGFHDAQTLFDPIWKEFLREVTRGHPHAFGALLTSVVHLNFFASREIAGVMVAASKRPLADLAAEACASFEADMAVYAMHTRPWRERRAAVGPARRPVTSPGASDDRAHLKAFLTRPSNPPGVLSYHELQGFMFGVSSAPRPIALHEWLPLALGATPPDLALDDLEPIMEELMDLYREIDGRAARGVVNLPPDCPLAPEPMANLDPASPVSQWSRGFLAAHNWLAKDWTEILMILIKEDGPTATKLSEATLQLLFFSSHAMANAVGGDGQRGSLAQLAAEAHHEFEPAMVFYAEMGRGFRTQWVRRSRPDVPLAPPAATRPATSSPRVGRNAPCPCGSGRKHKHCCGGTRH